MSNIQRASRFYLKIESACRRRTGIRLLQATNFLADKVRVEISIPYVPGTKTPIGKPVRKRTGNLYRKVQVIKVSETICKITANARSKNFWYGKYHELPNPRYRMSGKHPFLRPTAAKYRQNVAFILGGRVHTS